jgi:hypothetical protein
MRRMIASVVGATLLLAAGLAVGGPTMPTAVAIVGPGTGAVFTDVPADYPYCVAIESLQSSGIVSGYETAPGVFAFRPYYPVRRAQFAKMIVGARHLPVDESLVSAFTDLGPDDPGNLYPHEYVAAAAQAGITSGETPTTFGPYNSITRAQVVTMIMRALYNDPSVSLPPVPPGFSGSLGMFDPVHGPTMRHAEYVGLLGGIQGFGSGWDPWALANRGEVAQILYTMMVS